MLLSQKSNSKKPLKIKKSAHYDIPPLVRKNALVTDRTTDLNFLPFVNETKINRDHQKSLEELEKKNEMQIIDDISLSSDMNKLPLNSDDSKSSRDINYNSDSSKNSSQNTDIEEVKLKTIGTMRNRIPSIKKNPRENSENSENSIRRNGNGNLNTPYEKKNTSRSSKSDSGPPFEKILKNPKQFEETEETKRGKCREIFEKLMKLKKEKGIELSKPFSIDSNLTEMEEEYAYHYRQLRQANKTRLYKNMIKNGMTLLELANDHFDPFGFRAPGLTDNINEKLDEHDDIFDEIYHKYNRPSPNGSGGDGSGILPSSWPPEFRLMIHIIGGCGMYYLSTKLLEKGSLSSAIEGDKNIISEFSNEIKKNTNDNDGKETKEELLERLRKRSSTPAVPSTVEPEINTNQPIIVSLREQMERINKEREIEKKIFIDEINKITKMYEAKIAQVSIMKDKVEVDLRNAHNSIAAKHNNDTDNDYSDRHGRSRSRNRNRNRNRSDSNGNSDVNSNSDSYSQNNKSDTKKKNSPTKKDTRSTPLSSLVYDSIDNIIGTGTPENKRANQSMIVDKLLSDALTNSDIFKATDPKVKFAPTVTNYSPKNNIGIGNVPLKKNIGYSEIDDTLESFEKDFDQDIDFSDHTVTSQTQSQTGKNGSATKRRSAGQSAKKSLNGKNNLTII
jgi:hypothetical protein